MGDLPRLTVMSANVLATLLRRRASGVSVQLFRYALVGGLAFAVDFGLLAAFTEVCGLPYLLSACLSFVAGLAVNYLLSIVWVFGVSPGGGRRAALEFVLFAVVGIIGLGLNALIMWVGVEVASLHYLLSKIISTGVVFVWNFMARRTLLSNPYIICKIKTYLPGGARQQ